MPKTTQADLFMHNDTGKLVCSEHMGRYLRAAVAKRPQGSFFSTPLGTWWAVWKRACDCGCGNLWSCETCERLVIQEAEASV